MAAQKSISETTPVSFETKRRTAHEILDEAADLARGELERPARALAFSGIAGGLTIGLTGLAVAAARAELGSAQGAHFIAQLFYPVGFIAVIIGRAQLFTENTLFPVVLVLSERHYLGQTLRLWTLVFFGNIAGAFLFALLMARTHAALPDIGKELAILGMEAAAHPASTVFWTGVVGGWLIALVAWMVTASHWTIGQIVVIWLLTFVVGVGHFAHCIATTGEIMTAVFAGHIAFGEYLRWIVPATAGNIVGGVMIVSLLNWGQVKAGQEER